MKNFVVIGLGRFGSAVAKTLCELGHEVLAIDKDEEMVEAISSDVTHAVVADVIDEYSLKALGVRNFNVAIVAMGADMQSSILATLVLKDMGMPCIVAKAQNDLHAKVLERVGANKVIFPERDMGVRVANNLAITNILDYIELSPKYSIVEISPPQSWIGKSLVQLNVRAKNNINIIAIKRGSNINISPNADDVFSEGDIAVVIGANSDISALHKHK